jgi:hypothetical protein
MTCCVARLSANPNLVIQGLQVKAEQGNVSIRPWEPMKRSSP